MTPAVVVCLRCGHHYPTARAGGRRFIVTQSHCCPRCSYVGWTPEPAAALHSSGNVAVKRNG